MIRKGTTRSGVSGSIWVLAIFLSLVHQDDFILHILIVLNSLNELKVVSLMFCIINEPDLCKKELKLRFLAVLMSLVGLHAMNNSLTMHSKHNSCKKMQKLWSLVVIPSLLLY